MLHGPLTGIGYNGAVHLFAVAVAVLAAASAAASSPRSVVAPGLVEALAFDGGRIAYAAGQSTSDCDRVYVWNRYTRAVAQLGRRTSCIETSTGTGTAALAIAGTRVLWLHYTGGNLREWTLWTATTTKPRPVRLQFATADVDAPPPIVVGDGDSGRLGDILPYAVGETVIGLRENGSRRFAWSAPDRVVALSALAGELAVAHEGGHVTVLDAAGRELGSATYPGEVSAVKVTGTGVIVQYDRTLQLGSGPAAKTWTLPAGARLVDAAPERAIYVSQGRVHHLFTAGRLDFVAGAGTLAQVEGLWQAAATGRRVTLREPRFR